MLKLLGITNDVGFVLDGQDVIDKVSTASTTTNAFALIILDFYLPDRGGIEVVQEVRSLYQERNIRQEPHFVFLSADVDKSMIARANKIKVPDVLKKPLCANELYEIAMRIGLLDRVKDAPLVVDVS